MMNTYLNLRRKVTALLAFSCLLWVSAQAQQSISGKITDADDGSGIPGVNVVEQGTTKNYKKFFVYEYSHIRILTE